MSTVIRWEEPPVHGNTGRAQPRPSKYAAVIAELKANPARWALIADGLTTGHAGALAHRIRFGKLREFAPADTFETRCVGAVGSTDSKVYARYVGPVTA